MIESVLQAAGAAFAAIEVPFKQQLLPLQTVQHGGQFGEAEIEQLPIKQPSVLLTVLSWSRMESSKVLSGKPYLVTFAAVIATVNAEPLARRMQCVSVAAAITKQLENQFWSLDSNKISAAKLVQSRNLYSQSAQKKGVSLWAITWTHEMHLLGVPASEAPALYRLHEMQMSSDIHGSLDDAPEMEGSTLPEYGDLNPEPEMP
jgi:hypothetical protein